MALGVQPEDVMPTKDGFGQGPGLHHFFDNPAAVDVTFLLLFIVYAIVLAAGLARRGLRSVTKISGARSGELLTRVLIVGATGGTGRQLLAQALEREYVVTALVRDPGTLSVEHPRLTVVRGDVLEYSTVEKAVRGQDAVISALGHKRFFIPTRTLSEGTRNILHAMETHGVRRFVCETSLGIGDSVGRMGLYYSLFVIPVILPWYFWDKTRQEQLIAASKLEWVVGIDIDEKLRRKHGAGAN